MTAVPDIDIRPDHREIVRNILARHVPDREVRAFGSRTTWTAKDYSDLDLCVMGEAPLSLTTLATLEEAFVESDLPFKVDLVDWATTKEPFRQIIEKEFMVVQEGRMGGGEWQIIPFEKAPLEIIDGDRGKNYPKKTDFSAIGYCLFLNAGNVTATGFNSSNCTFITAKKDASLRKGRLLKRDVVLTTRGTVGNVAYFDDSVPFENIRINSGMVILRSLPSSLDPQFLYLFVRSELFHSQVSALRTGSAQPQLPIRDINRIEIPIPPLPEQRAIAHVLGTLDDKIELNRRMNETLEDMARALFKSWFVDFDPVHAKAEGRQPHGMDEETAALFPDGFEESEVGLVPEGWVVGRLGELSYKPQYGYTASAKDKPIGPKFLRITDINKTTWIDWATVPYCEISDKDFKKYHLHKGDVLIARMADPGHGVMIENDQKAVFASYLIRFRPINELFARFLQYWLRSDRYWQFVKGMGAGTTRVSLNAKVLSGFPLIVPPIHIAEAFGKQVGRLRKHVVANASEIQSLATLRDTLLPKLIAGELRVKDAERILKERDL